LGVGKKKTKQKGKYKSCQHSGRRENSLVQEGPKRGFIKEEMNTLSAGGGDPEDLSKGAFGHHLALQKTGSIVGSWGEMEKSMCPAATKCKLKKGYRY